MKISLTFLFLLFLSASAFAQEPETDNPVSRKFYVGVDFNVAPYYFHHNLIQSNSVRLGTTYTAYPSIHVGYMLSKRASIQVGVGYAGNRTNMGYDYNNAGVIEGSRNNTKTRGFVIPVTFRYNFLNISKRLQAFGFGSLTTAYANSTFRNTKTRDGVITETHKFNESALNVFLSLGIGLNYKISNRVNAFGEYSVFNKSLAKGYNYQKRPFDIGLFNLGLNYKF